MTERYNRKRKIIETLLADNPALKTKPAQALMDAYEKTFSQEEDQGKKTRGFSSGVYSKDRRYTFEQSLDDDFYPD